MRILATKFALTVVFILLSSGPAGASVALAATTPSLVIATTYALLSDTFTNQQAQQPSTETSDSLLHQQFRHLADIRRALIQIMVLTHPMLQPVLIKVLL